MAYDNYYDGGGFAPYVSAGMQRARAARALTQLQIAGEVLLTEMKDDDLLKLVALDLNTASEE